MILFLDFDGVLHPIPLGGRQDLCYIPRLQQVLRDFPQVRVVISSMWRYDQDLETLQSYFSEDIAARIIGVTPRADDTMPSDWGFMFPQTRYKECVQWVQDNRYDGLWCCLDDAWREFPDPCHQLIRCETALGLDEDAEARLRERLAVWHRI